MINTFRFVTFNQISDDNQFLFFPPQKWKTSDLYIKLKIEITIDSMGHRPTLSFKYSQM